MDEPPTQPLPKNLHHQCPRKSPNRSKRRTKPPKLLTPFLLFLSVVYHSVSSTRVRQTSQDYTGNPTMLITNHLLKLLPHADQLNPISRFTIAPPGRAVHLGWLYRRWRRWRGRSALPPTVHSTLVGFLQRPLRHRPRVVYPFIMKPDEFARRFLFTPPLVIIVVINLHPARVCPLPMIATRLGRLLFFATFYFNPRSQTSSAFSLSAPDYCYSPSRRVVSPLIASVIGRYNPADPCRNGHRKITANGVHTVKWSVNRFILVITLYWRGVRKLFFLHSLEVI